MIELNEAQKEEMRRRNAAVVDVFNNNIAAAAYNQNVSRGERYEAERLFKQQCRDLAPGFLDKLKAIADDETAKKSDRIKAMTYVIDRGYGVPKQQIDNSSDKNGDGDLEVIPRGMSGLLEAVKKSIPPMIELKRNQDNSDEPGAF